MTRTQFSLTDEQAGKLLLLVPPLREKHPPGGPSNRAFVHDFIKAVHTATGRTFSPAIYRRLLNTYAPDRKPSTNTLALEKEAVEREMSGSAIPPLRMAAQAPESPYRPQEDMGDLVRRAVEDALALQLRRIADALSTDLKMAQDHIADLGARLAASDRALAEARVHAARLASELHASTEREAIVRKRLEDAEVAALAQMQSQATALQSVSDELSEIRKFAMRSIDDVRGETRVERDRRVQIEELLKRNERLMEVFRQAAYARGGTIPAELRMEPR
ncbi:hypothetical protein [Massilia sp. LjRoot122]|uniref:hypothetical protein n=1 Tax=Massilia sp. LjRoot122 TaxID=3342257 RepID=UPI003ECF8E42